MSAKLHHLFVCCMLVLSEFTYSFTVTTFNILAPVHRSMGTGRESERETWWRPRAEAVATYISDHLSNSDIILLQEWWFDDKYVQVFDSILGGQFDRVAERRPKLRTDSNYTYFQQSHDQNGIRDDGMACLINKNGKLDVMSSSKVLTGPERIAQIVHCKEKGSSGCERDIIIANTHLSFPKDEDKIKNDRRQAYEINLIQRALSKVSSSGEEVLELICGDFNSEPNGLASAQLEIREFINCASAKGESIGVTHCAHTGQMMSADRIFVRLPQRQRSTPVSSPVGYTFERNSVTSTGRRAPSIGYQDPLSLGCIDSVGTEVVNVRSEDIQIRGFGVLSDHKPVTATLRWSRFRSVGQFSEPYVSFSNSTLPLDPLSCL